MAAEAFGYLLAYKVNQGLVKGISLPNTSKQLVNGHFADDSPLISAEDETSVSNALECLDTFCLASGSSIQWRKTSCYKKNL